MGFILYCAITTKGKQLRSKSNTKSDKSAVFHLKKFVKPIINLKINLEEKGKFKLPISNYFINKKLTISCATPSEGNIYRIADSFSRSLKLYELAWTNLWSNCYKKWIFSDLWCLYWFRQSQRLLHLFHFVILRQTAVLDWNRFWRLAMKRLSAHLLLLFQFCMSLLSSRI